MSSRKWTPADIRLLRKHYPSMPMPELCQALGRSSSAIYYRARRAGLRRSTEFMQKILRKLGAEMARGRGYVWDEAKVELLKKHYATMPIDELSRLVNRTRNAIYVKAHDLGLKRDSQFLAEQNRRLGRALSGISRGTQFQKGHVPANKGVKGFDAGGRSHETRFSPGHRPQTWKPIGSERLSTEGYLQRKVTDTGYPPRDWRAVHVMLWEVVNGPVPRGHKVCFIDGDKTNIVYMNLELVSDAEMMRRNTIRRYPKDVALCAQALGRVKKAIQRRSRNEKQDRRSQRPSVRDAGAPQG